MKNLLSLFFISSIYLLTAFGQTQFQWTIGGTSNDYANTIVRTTDGGYVVGGWSGSGAPGDDRLYIVKIDASGSLQWSRIVGGTNTDAAYSIIQTTDGGYVAVGQTNSFGAGINDFYIVKFDGSSTLQWTRSVGGTGSDYARSIIQTTDGGYVAVGQTNSFGVGGNDMYVVKLDGSGTLQWSRSVGGTSSDIGYSIIQTIDGGYVMAGSTASFGAGGNDMYVVKLDGSGTLQWSRTIGGTGADIASSIIQTIDGGYVMAGSTASFGAGSNDMYVVKLDGSGTLQWTRSVGGTGSDYASSAIQTTDGGYAIAGLTNSFGAGGYDMYIAKLDGNGTLLWNRTAGGTGNDYAYSIIQTTDGRCVVAGYTSSFGAGNIDIFIVKLDIGGNTCGNSTSPQIISGTGGTTTSPTPTVTTPTPTVTTPTPTTSTGGTVTSICTTVGIQPILIEIPDAYKLEQNYPNPFNPATKIKFALPNSSFATIVIYDALGRKLEIIINEQLNAGTYEADWDASNYPSGIYLYKLTAWDFTETKKMVLIK